MAIKIFFKPNQKLACVINRVKKFNLGHMGPLCRLVPLTFYQVNESSSWKWFTSLFFCTQYTKSFSLQCLKVLRIHSNPYHFSSRDHRCSIRLGHTCHSHANHRDTLSSHRGSICGKGHTETRLTNCRERDCQT